MRAGGSRAMSPSGVRAACKPAGLRSGLARVPVPQRTRATVVVARRPGSSAAPRCLESCRLLTSLPGCLCLDRLCRLCRLCRLGRLGCGIGLLDARVPLLRQLRLLPLPPRLQRIPPLC